MPMPESSADALKPRTTPSLLSTSQPKCMPNHQEGIEKV
ncbi:hypothetical protein AVDCRST_MAG94-3729 [uncultured Leptolyngbya sp.]|uniref:Uncharacterized protein n=1 Tax=uncultured Leptolyngbya sp. TaxID=332963 RepID=A0A6J4MQS8_9CYAN|nr:hypothetical protein AVDCRST_MAG94-3729 [uncultured Leptolyngbya sp.]